MRMRVVASIVLLGSLGACTSQFSAQVTRFHMLPPPAGQTFTVVAADPAKTGSLEFLTYANLVRQRMVKVGFTEAPSPAAAELIASFDYGVGPGRTMIESTPGWGAPMSPWGWGGGWGYGGWGGPGWGGGWGGAGWGWSAPQVYSVVEFTTTVELDIARAVDNLQLFEGRAETTTNNNALTTTVPNLITALFVGFPGTSGETVQIRFDPANPPPP